MARVKVVNKKQARFVECLLKYLLFAVLLAVMLFPFLSMILNSLMTMKDINATETLFFPTEVTFENYAEFGKYARYFGNSLIVVVINAVLVPLTSCMVAFPLARYRFRGSGFMFALILATSMIPSSVVQVPQYTLFVKFGLYDKLASQFIGAFFGGSGMQIFLIIQFMRAIPKELDEAATIDGASIFRVFVTIMLPLCFNIYIYLAIGVAIAQWNNFQGPLIFIKSPEKYTIAAAFYYFFGAGSDSGIKANVTMAMAAIMTLFPAILFFFFQKQMIGGVKLGAVKG